jgi:hypothetical protein
MSGAASRTALQAVLSALLERGAFDYSQQTLYSIQIDAVRNVCDGLYSGETS